MDINYVNGCAYGASEELVVGGSPWSWQNPYAGPVIFVIEGGTLTLVQFSPDGSHWAGAGLLTGYHRVAPRQWMKLTFLVAPSSVWIQPAG